MSEAAAGAFLREARELPIMPPVAVEVIRRADDPDSDTRDVAELIARDPGLALRVLRIANSSIYSLPREIETVQQAIILLGYSTLRSVVVAASLKDVFSHFGLSERLLWDHAIGASVAGVTLATRLEGFSTDEVFVAGLVHDLGKLTLHVEAPEDYQRVAQLVLSEGSDLIDCEREILGFDHAMLGGLLLRRWGLSQRLSEAVAAHHDPISAPESAMPLAALLQLADRLCLQQGIGRADAQELDPLDCEGARILGIEDSDSEELIADFKEKYEAERELFT